MYRQTNQDNYKSTTEAIMITSEEESLLSTVKTNNFDYIHCSKPETRAYAEVAYI